jgi:uncharacterized membrane protein YfcA
MTLELISQHALLLIVIISAYFIRGVTGFGSGLIAVPLLAFSYPLQMVVPLILAMDFIASFLLGSASAKQADWTEIKRLLPFAAIGAAFGVFALIRFPSVVVLLAMGLFVMYFGMRNVLGIQPQGRVSALWALPAGLIGSTAGALFGTSGPPYIIYLTHRLQDKTAIRATFSWLFVIDGGLRLTLFAVTGLLFAPETQIAIAAALLPMMAGLYLGNKVHLNISKETLLKLVGAILVASGGSLIAKAII